MDTTSLVKTIDKTCRAIHRVRYGFEWLQSLIRFSPFPPPPPYIQNIYMYGIYYIAGSNQNRLHGLPLAETAGYSIRKS